MKGLGLEIEEVEMFVNFLKELSHSYEKHLEMKTATAREIAKRAWFIQRDGLARKPFLDALETDINQHTKEALIELKAKIYTELSRQKGDEYKDAIDLIDEQISKLK